MPDATITSTASTFGTISGTFAADQSTVTGTVTAITGSVDGSVGVPGPQGQQGIQGIQGDPGSPGAPGQGVAVGGTTGQVLQKLSATNYDTGWLTLPSDFITSVTAPLAVGSGVLSVDLSAYLTTSAAASTYYLQTNPSGFQTAANVTTALSPYLLSATAASTYAVIAAGQPVAGSTGQVLTKQSGTNYDSIWVTPVVGDRYLTTSTTSLTINNANKTLTIGTGLSYTPTQNITISYDASNHMHGEVLTYNSGTGVLTVDVNHHTGSGTYASWVVNVGGVTPATSVAWGAITGTLSTQTDLQSALNLKLDATTAASDYLSKAGNLSGLANVTTARNNLLLGATNTVAFQAVNLSEGAPEIDDTLSTLNVNTSSSGYSVGGSTASYVDDGFGAAIVSESCSFGLDKNNFSLALYPTYDTSNPSSPTSGIELNYVTATGVLSLRAYDNPGSTDYVTTLSPFGLILPASGGSITFGDATVQTTAAFNPDLSPYAPLASPTFTGTPTLPTGTIATTQSPGDNTTALATTAFVTAAVPAFATKVEASELTSTTKTLSPSSGLGTIMADTGVLRPMSSAFTSASSGTGASGAVYYGAGLANSPNASVVGYGGFYYGVEAHCPGANNRRIINWVKPIGVNVFLNRDNAAFASGITFRITLGKGASGGTLTTKGIGVDIAAANSFVKILAHNGTTLTTTDSTCPISQFTNVVVTRQICVLSYGTGTVELFVDGVSYGTSSGGPTTLGTISQNRFSLENYGDGTQVSQSTVGYFNPKVITAL